MRVHATTNEGMACLAFWRIIAVVLFSLFGQLVLHAQDPIAELESKLEATQGQERLKILHELMQHYASRQPRTVMDHGAEALELLRTLPDQETEASLKSIMSVAAFRLGELERALDLAEDSRRISLDLGNLGLASTCTNMLGTIHASRGEYDLALNFYGQTLDAHRKSGDQGGVASALHNMGLVYRRMGDLDKALEHNLESVRINIELGKQEQVARTYSNIASIYHGLDSFDVALDYLHRALEIHKKRNNKMGIAPVLNNIGEIHLAMGDPQTALDYLYRSLAIKQELGTKPGIAFSLDAIGKAHLDMCDYERARECFVEALDIFREVGENSGTIDGHLQLAVLYKITGDFEKALHHLHQVIDLARESNATSQLCNGFELLAQIQEIQGQHQDALASLKRFKQLHDEVINEETSMNIAQLEARFEADQKAKEIALLKKTNQIQTLAVERQKLLRNMWVLITVGLGLLFGSALFIQNRRSLRKRLEQRVEERTQALVTIQAQMADTAHRAGMAEIAFDILRNVENSLHQAHASAGELLTKLNNTSSLDALVTIAHRTEKQTDDESIPDPSAPPQDTPPPWTLVELNHDLNQHREHLIQEVVLLKEKLNEINALIKAQDRYAALSHSGEEINLEALVDREIENQKRSLTALQVEVTRDYAGLPHVFTQKFKVARIINHLLQNAMDSVKTLPSSRARHITVKTSLDRDRQINLEIQDNGVGISPEQMGRVFSPGFTSEHHASGLSLHFCANSATELGGHLQAHSDGVGLGARFTLTLPNTSASETGPHNPS